MLVLNSYLYFWVIRVCADKGLFLSKFNFFLILLNYNLLRRIYSLKISIVLTSFSKFIKILIFLFSLVHTIHAEKVQVIDDNVYQKESSYLENDLLTRFDKFIHEVIFLSSKLKNKLIKTVKGSYNAFIEWGKKENLLSTVSLLFFAFLFIFLISHLIASRRENRKIFFLKNTNSISVYIKLFNYSLHLLQYFFSCVVLFYIVVYALVTIFDSMYDKQVWVYFAAYIKIFLFISFYAIGLRFLYTSLSWAISILSVNKDLLEIKNHFYALKVFLNRIFTPIWVLQRVLLISKYQNTENSLASFYIRVMGETLEPFQQLLQLFLMFSIFCLFSFLILKLRKDIKALLCTQGTRHNFIPLKTIGNFWYVWSFLITFSVFQSWFSFVNEVDLCYLFLAIVFITLFTLISYYSPIIYDSIFKDVSSDKSIQFYIEHVLQWTILVVFLLMCDVLLSFVKVPLVSFVLNSTGFILLHDFLLVVLFGACAIILLNLLQSLAKHLIKNLFPPKAMFSLNILINKAFWFIRIFVKILLLLSILEKWLLPSIPLVKMLFVLVIALGIYSKDVISKIFKSLSFLIAAPVKEGDRIVVASNTLEAGIIVNLGLFNLELINEYNEKTTVYYANICSFRQIGKDEDMRGLNST